MKPEEVSRILGGTPWMSVEQGVEITEFIRENGIRDILELGFLHGTSTCYLAAALRESGGGSVVSIDLEGARALDPNIEELLDRCGLTDLVACHFEPTSYNWRMMRFLEQDPAPRFDFCYLDGPHNWYVDGFAFFLVDRLLRPGGWILFDDLDWIPGDSRTDREDVRKMTGEERRLPHMRKVYELLVRPHPNYGDFRVSGQWAYARKLEGPPSGSENVRTETIYVMQRGPALHQRIAARLKRLVRPGARTLAASEERDKSGNPIYPK